jgi:hypothetical protein
MRYLNCLWGVLRSEYGGGWVELEVNKVGSGLENERDRMENLVGGEKNTSVGTSEGLMMENVSEKVGDGGRVTVNARGTTTGVPSTSSRSGGMSGRSSVVRKGEPRSVLKRREKSWFMFKNDNHNGSQPLFVVAQDVSLVSVLQLSRVFREQDEGEIQGYPGALGIGGWDRELMTRTVCAE